MAQNLNKDITKLADSTSLLSPVTKRDRLEISEDMGIVPDVIGMGAKDAIHILSTRGINVNLQGTGIVKSQSIAPGTKIENKTTINIHLE
jgi:hypothetical protein